MKNKLYILASLLLLIPFFSNAQQGAPFIRNYDPEEYKGAGQVWDIVQDNRGVMYFASNGVLEFDGVNWRDIDISPNQTVRSLAIDTITNTVYVGCVGGFGCLRPDSTGELKYFSLSEKLTSEDQDFTDVWKTEVGRDGVYFSTNFAFFRYRIIDAETGQDTITVWKDRRSFFLVFKAYGDIYTLMGQRGLVRVDGDSLVELNKEDPQLRRQTWFTLPYGENKILLGNQAMGLNIFDPDAPDKTKSLFKTPFFDSLSIIETDKFLADNQLYGGVALDNGNYALATIRSGVIIVDQKGKIVNHICKENGLQSQTVHYLFQDRQKGLWAALTYGISRIEVNSPISQWNSKNGISGSIYNAIKNNGRMYVSSNLGLFANDKTGFVPIPQLTGSNALQCFVLENIKIPGEKNSHFLAGTTSGIFSVNGINAKPAIPIVCFQIYQSPVNPRISFVDDETNILYIKYENGRWIKGDTLIALDGFPSSFSLDPESRLWFIIDSKPAVAVVSSDNKKLVDFVDFRKKEAIEDLSFYSTCIIDDNVIFSTDDGLWRYDTENKKFFEDSLIFDGILSNQKLSITQVEIVNDNEVWMVISRNEKRSILKVFQDNGRYTIDSTSFKRLPPFDDIRADGDSIMWIVSPKALYQYDITMQMEYYTKESALNRQVLINNDSIIFNGAYYKENNGNRYLEIKQSDSHIPQLLADENNICFEFALPSYDDETKNKYQYSLIRNNGQETWSGWSDETKKEYTNLADGDYVFKVRARNIYLAESEISSYRFSIIKPWYKTGLAYTFYAILIIIAIWFIVRLNTYRLKQKNLLLEATIRKRTKEIWEQKEEIKEQADNLREVNDQLVFKNQEINQQNAEIMTQRDNLEMMTEHLQQYNEEISAQRDELENQRNTLSEQKELIESIHSDLTDSIEYSERIQSSILPDLSMLNDSVNDHFVLFKPRDIVSGDFYWFANRNNVTIIVAADCTGHGVPGAMMSFLGISLLKEIVEKQGLTEPGMILDELRGGIIDALRQKQRSEIADEGASRVRDGMDIALIAINNNDNFVKTAGANNSVFIVRDCKSDINENCIKPFDSPLESLRYYRSESKELLEIKGDKMPIGIFPRMNSFTTHQIQSQKGDCFYLFSDGYADQFGGEKHKKFKFKSFRELILMNCGSSMEKQKSTLEQTYNEWKGDSEQIDDIVVIGAKI